MSTDLNLVPAQELKRRGTAAIEERLSRGPVHVLRCNRPVFVALSEEDFRALVEDAAAARLAASLADVREGRVRYGAAADLVQELDE
jgi:PHD/YefM family antitoxin component YafN of YafNO toxin-antitoxin module